MKLTAMSVVIAAIGTILRGLIKEREDVEIRGKVETIQTAVLLRILRSVLET